MPTRGLSIPEPLHEGMDVESLLRESLALAIDSRGRIVAVTPEAARMLLPSSAQGRTASSDLLPRPLQSVIRNAQTSGRSVTEYQVMLPAGNAKPVDVRVTVFASPTDSQSGVLVMLREGSQSGQLQHYLQQLDRLASLGTLSASMAHEIRNALVAIKTFIDLLLEKNQDAELATIVRREMARLDAIVCHMLKFATPPQPSFVPIRLHDILDHSLRVVQHRVGDKVIAIRREFNASPDFFTGDDHQLEQAFANLLLNAVEAIDAEGSLTVGTDLAPANDSYQFREAPAAVGFLRVKITDTGAGIAPELLERVFDPFFTTKKNGTGLGLPVTRRIIEEHHGTIEVESQPDKGTTFTICLPRTAASPR